MKSQENCLVCICVCRHYANKQKGIIDRTLSLVSSWSSEGTCKPKDLFPVVLLSSEAGPALVSSVRQQVCPCNSLTIKWQWESQCCSDPASTKVIRLCTVLLLKSQYRSTHLTTWTTSELPCVLNSSSGRWRIPYVEHWDRPFREYCAHNV